MPSAYATIALLAFPKVPAQHSGRLTDIPALRHEDAQEEQAEADNGADPSVEDMRCRLIKERLVMLQSVSFLFVSTSP